MALVWPSKAPSDVKRYTWDVPLRDGDSVSSFSASPTNAVIDASEERDGQVILFISGGTAGTTASFLLSAQTSEGEGLTDTAYLPIVASTGSTATAADIIEYALRTIVGMGESAETVETADVLEQLNDMLAEWGLSGADIGCTFPLLEATEINVPLAWVSAIKENLKARIAGGYGYEVSPSTQMKANVGLQVIKMSLLEREPAVYF